MVPLAGRQSLSDLEASQTAYYRRQAEEMALVFESAGSGGQNKRQQQQQQTELRCWTEETAVGLGSEEDLSTPELISGHLNMVTSTGTRHHRLAVFARIYR